MLGESVVQSGVSVCSLDGEITYALPQRTAMRAATLPAIMQPQAKAYGYRTKAEKRRRPCGKAPLENYRLLTTEARKNLPLGNMFLNSMGRSEVLLMQLLEEK